MLMDKMGLFNCTIRVEAAIEVETFLPEYMIPVSSKKSYSS